MEDRDTRIKDSRQQEPEEARDCDIAEEAGRYIMVPVAELARLYRLEGRIAALMDFIPDGGEVDREVAELILLGRREGTQAAEGFDVEAAAKKILAEDPLARRYERYDA